VSGERHSPSSDCRLVKRLNTVNLKLKETGPLFSLRARTATPHRYSLQNFCQSFNSGEQTINLGPFPRVYMNACVVASCVSMVRTRLRVLPVAMEVICGQLPQERLDEPEQRYDDMITDDGTDCDEGDCDQHAVAHSGGASDVT
jgi:hypothetical protein